MVQRTRVGVICEHANTPMLAWKGQPDKRPGPPKANDFQGALQDHNWRADRPNFIFDSES